MIKQSKNNAEYYQHDASMRHDSRVLALRHKYSFTGYAVWCFLLEALTDSDNYEIRLDDVTLEILSADFGLEADKLTEIIDYMVRLGLMRLEEGILYSATLKDRFDSLTTKRERSRSYYISRKNVGEYQDGIQTDSEDFKRDQNDFKKIQTDSDGFKKIKIDSNDFKRDSNDFKKIQTDSDGFKKIKQNSVPKSKSIELELEEKDKSFSSYVAPNGATREFDEPAKPPDGDKEGLDYDGIAAFFNEEAGSVFGRIRTPMTDQRRTQVKARVSEVGMGEFKETIKRAARSDFLSGKVGRGWVASFDWLIKRSNFQKILEGNYDNDRGKNRATSDGIGEADEGFLRSVAEGIARGQYEINADPQVGGWEG